MKDLLKSVGQENLLGSVSTLKGIGPKSSKTLSKASIESVLDLLLLLPRKYKRRDRWFKVDKRLLPRTVTIEVLIKNHIYPKSLLEGNIFLVYYSIQYIHQQFIPFL